MSETRRLVEHKAYAWRELSEADALLLGRATYEVFSTAYPATGGRESEVFSQFIARMNSIPKYVASTTLNATSWNATVIDGDVASFVTDLKERPAATSSSTGTARSMSR